MTISRIIEIQYKPGGPWVPRNTKGLSLNIYYPQIPCGVDSHPSKIGEYVFTPLPWLQGEMELSLETPLGDEPIYDIRVQDEKSFRERGASTCEIADMMR